MKSFAIIPSNRQDDLDDCLSSISNQILPIDKVIIVSWGSKQEKEEIRNICNKHENLINIEIVHPKNGTTIADSRNAGLDHIRKNPPNIVLFIDDDMVLHDNWHRCMHENYEEKYYQMQASVTIWRADNSKIQSCGHYFDNFRPLDLGYNRDVNIKNQLRNPLFPCANGAFISWDIISEIENIERVWDNKYGRLTCFEFGLKSYLLGYRCKLIYDALGFHKGYLANGNSLSEAHVKKELIAKQLLYFKFLPGDLRLEAISELDAKIKNKWWYIGYPHSRELKGEKLLNLYNTTKREVMIEKEGITDYWRKKAGLLTSEKQKFLFRAASYMGLPRLF